MVYCTYMRRYKYKHAYEWSADVAYCVGLIASDGCLSSDGRHIDLTSKDIDLLETFKRLLDLNAKIGTKGDGRGGSCYRVQFSNVAFYDFLLGVGLTPNKSKTLQIRYIPDIYYPDFLRGCFDGDGSTYAYWDKRWKSSHMFYSVFVSASHSFICWLTENNYRLAGLGDLKPRMESRVWCIKYAKK